MTTEAKADQQSDEWRQARAGNITASRFKDVLAQPRAKADREAGKLSATAQRYLCELMLERLTGAPTDGYSGESTEHGHDNEEAAREIYTWETGRHVVETGFCVHPDIPDVGGSPDGLVGADGIVEIKCPFNAAIHISTVLDDAMPKEHVAQVQGLMWVLGRQWCDFISYSPAIGEAGHFFLTRVERDDGFIVTLEAAVLAFRERFLTELETFV